MNSNTHTQTNSAGRPGTKSAATIERALKVVAEILDEGGEARLRLAEVSRRSNVSIGSLYHHFDSRDGLIRAARERQFRDSLPAKATEHLSEMLTAKSADAFVERTVAGMRAESSPSSSHARRRRLELLGLAASRPGSLGGVTGALTEYLDQLEATVQGLADRGWLREGIDTRALALFLYMGSMGRVIWNLDDRRGREDETWIRMYGAALRGLLAEDA
jgi:AcrR family transcriptional regulator